MGCSFIIEGYHLKKTKKKKKQKKQTVCPLKAFSLNELFLCAQEKGFGNFQCSVNVL